MLNPLAYGLAFQAGCSSVLGGGNGHFIASKMRQFEFRREAKQESVLSLIIGHAQSLGVA
jgi:hypothetical protein